jgi:DNA-binding NarL/FixJ family response regulator
MDIQLPGRNGLQLTREIKARYPNTKVIILTSHDLPEYREVAVQCGASSFFSKGSLIWGEIEAFIKSILAASIFCPPFIDGGFCCV